MASPLLWATVLLAIARPLPLFAQAETENGALRVFLDCQTFGCDFDLVRREIVWVDWIREREDSDVHLLVTSTQTGAGTLFDMRFIGRGRFEGEDASLSHASSSTDTQDEVRRGLIERFRLGLVGYAGGTPAADFLRVEYTAPAAAPTDTPENDPWNRGYSPSRRGDRRAPSR